MALVAWFPSGAVTMSALSQVGTRPDTTIDVANKQTLNLKRALVLKMFCSCNVNGRIK